MDIGSADPASLSAKRLELEKATPLAQKLSGLAEDRLAAYASSETSEHIARRPRPIKDSREKDGKKPKPPLHATDWYEGSAESGDDARDGPDDIGGPERHILDVKV